MTANLKIGPCPKCGSTTFITTAHLTPPTIEIVGGVKNSISFKKLRLLEPATNYLIERK